MRKTILILVLFSAPVFAQKLERDSLNARRKSIVTENKISPNFVNYKFDACIEIPKAAFFCRMENALSKKYSLNLRIRTGGY